MRRAGFNNNSVALLVMFSADDDEAGLDTLDPVLSGHY